MQMMFDEYEIVCWINFIDRFNFFDFCYDVNDVDQVLNSTFLNILYIAGATKSITNDDAKLKDSILVNIFGSNIRHFDKWRLQYGHKFDEHTGGSIFLKNH